MDTLLYFAIVVLAIGLAYLAYQNKKLRTSNQEILVKAETKPKITEIEKERITSEIERKLRREEEETRQRLLNLQEKIEEKESFLSKKLENIEAKREKIDELKEKLGQIKTDLLTKREEVEKKSREVDARITAELEKISGLKTLEVKNKIEEKAKEEMGNELLVWQQKYVTRAEDEANEEAREIVALAIQRCSSEVTNEFTLTTIKLEDDNQKGQIIGKGGRNIQWLEKTLGVELIIDETPGVISISGFSSVRRHTAKKTLESLLKDGRIHPASIEDHYNKAKANIAKEIAAAGQWAVNQLGIIDFPPKLIRIIGRLKFRTSYGQNMLKHSVEMAKLAGLLAQELNARFPSRQNPVDVDICIKGALLHDVGKAVDEETNPKGNHIELGEKICDLFGLDWRIRKCISSHHDESYYDEEKGFCVEAALVDACDNISGGRPGARKETAQAYFERMENLEKIAKDATGAKEAWVMRGSRELWIFFDTKTTTPRRMHEATRRVAKEIENTVRYPGEIKVIGLWEDKVVEYAH